ncbi:uncharacterized protein LOC129286509 [Prosopis cineraria]|uniref:uncharacterized protein LOC129286509 n=1 Tax=Prosopis cineraria TaxID=364024 RepID=UPI00240EBA1A|nr:uncharacterized protein LOC129286509 [Prosopis cineraria]
MASYKALYGRQCRSPIRLFDVGDTKLLGLDLVQDDIEKVKIIRERIISTQNRQKSYVDNQHQELEFMVRDKVFLKVSPMKRVMRFGKKGKLSLRYIGPFEILEKISAVAYRLALLLELSSIHLVFHVSMLRKYLYDPSHVIEAQGIQIAPDLSYEEVPVAILDRQVKKLWSKEITSVKVL